MAPMEQKPERKRGTETIALISPRQLCDLGNSALEEDRKGMGKMRPLQAKHFY